VEYKTLGRSGIQVSVIGIGTNQFGNPVDAEGVQTMLQAAMESGINAIDTADGYGGTLSEDYIGRAISNLGNRHDWVVMTKFGNYPMGKAPNNQGTSRGYLRKSIVGSLQRLRTDYIDLYQVHRWDPKTPVEETMSALNEVVREGLVRYVGCSNWAGWQIAEANEVARRYGWAPFVSSQPAYSLMNRTIEAEHVPACLHYGLGLIPYSPLAGGFLTGKHKRGEGAAPGTRLERNARASESTLTDANFDKLEAWEKIAADAGVTMTQLAVGWLTANPVTSTVICGATSVEQIRENAAIGDVKLSADTVAAASAVR
jgi:aryl-alcohol dehydrogenase-like predicted oxidoreductase